MRVLKPGQKVWLHESDDPTQSVEGIIRCVTVFEDMSVQYECRWWSEGSVDFAMFGRNELEVADPEYLTIQGE